MKMIKQTLTEWQEEAKNRFGDNPNSWKFVCPACGRVTSLKEFVDAGGDKNGVYQECIGRVNGKGSPDGKDNGFGCNWAAYGLFGNLGKGRIVITPKGNEIEVFDFADSEV